MLLSSLSFPTGGQCKLTFERSESWLRATWTGYVGTHEAMDGAKNYLDQVGPLHCLYLLNDNLALRGPWFESTRWLEVAWLPQAERLGLRYVAHVVQADTHADIMTLKYPPKHVVDSLELQLFYDVASAEDWLRSCQQPSTRESSPRRLGYADGQAY